MDIHVTILPCRAEYEYYSWRRLKSLWVILQPRMDLMNAMNHQIYDVESVVEMYTL